MKFIRCSIYDTSVSGWEREVEYPANAHQLFVSLDKILHFEREDIAIFKGLDVPNLICRRVVATTVSGDEYICFTGCASFAQSEDDIRSLDFVEV